MAPLNWLTLMMFFILIMSMFNMLNYYSFTYTIINKKSKKIKKNPMNWKW